MSTAVAKTENALVPPQSTPYLGLREHPLQAKLVETLRQAIPLQNALESASTRAQRSYAEIAAILVDLRHEFKGPGGEEFDLRGRSAMYRQVVRSAYIQSGVNADHAISKRITVGVAYWVRKILIERYGRERLCEMGILYGPSKVERRISRSFDNLPENPAACLDVVVGILNQLVTHPELVPSEEVVRSAVRAVGILRQRLSDLTIPMYMLAEVAET
jgi:hypothetical protein